MLPYIFRTQVGQTLQRLIKRHNYEKGVFFNLLANYSHNPYLVYDK